MASEYLCHDIIVIISGTEKKLKAHHEWTIMKLTENEKKNVYRQANKKKISQGPQTMSWAEVTHYPKPYVYSKDLGSNAYFLKLSAIGYPIHLRSLLGLAFQKCEILHCFFHCET
jgi:hypothetical protein